MLFIWDMLSSVQVSVGLGMGNFGFDERSKIDAHFAWLNFGENLLGGKKLENELCITNYLKRGMYTSDI